MGRPLPACGLLLALLAANACAQDAAPPPPGRLIDLGGYRLHLYSTGQGSPTVVLVPGASDHSLGGALVQPEVAQVTRVCAFDRGGEAWSDLGPRPRDKTQEAYDLRRLLRAAGEPPPYVLVGQSMGVDVIRLFAAEHPDEVAGLVLVDGADPDAMTNLNGRIGTTRSFSKHRPIPAPRDSITPGDTLTAEGVANIQKAIAQYHMEPSIDPPFDKLSAEMQKWRLWANGQPQHFVAFDSDYLGEEADKLYAVNHASAHPLADLPLVVLCRDTTVEKSHDPLHVVHQRAAARLSRRGVFEIVKGSGHEIHLYAPQVVAHAIEQVVLEARRGKPEPPHGQIGR